MTRESLPMSTSHSTTPEHERLMVMLEACVLDQLYAAHKKRKEALSHTFEPGEKHEVTNDQGLRMGSISKSQPNKKAVCVDPAILAGRATEKGMELIDHLPAEGTPEHVEAIDVLTKHASHLLPAPTVSKEDHAELAEEALEKWQITGKAPAGWEIRDASTPKFTVNKPRDKQGKAAIAHLVGQVHTILEIEQGEK